FAAIAERVAATQPARVGAIAGDLATVEEMFALKALVASFGSANRDCRQDGAKLDPAGGRGTYIFNPAIAGIDAADVILLVGSNPRREEAVLNARIRKHWWARDLRVGVVGERADLTYSYDYLGAGPETLANLTSAKADFAKVLSEAKRPLVIVGTGALARADGAAVWALAALLAGGNRDEGWNGLAVLHTAASRVGGLDVGFVPGQGGLDTAGMLAPGALDVLFLLGADEVDVPPGAFVVYLGTH